MDAIVNGVVFTCITIDIVPVFPIIIRARHAKRIGKRRQNLLDAGKIKFVRNVLLDARIPSERRGSAASRRKKRPRRS